MSWWRSSCKGRKSIHDDSFFTKSRLTLQKWLLIMCMWARQYPVTDIGEEVEAALHTAIQTYQGLREVCSTRLQQAPIAIRLNLMTIGNTIDNINCRWMRNGTGPRIVYGFIETPIAAVGVRLVPVKCVCPPSNKG